MAAHRERLRRVFVYSWARRIILRVRVEAAVHECRLGAVLPRPSNRVVETEEIANTGKMFGRGAIEPKCGCRKAALEITSQLLIEHSRPEL